MTKTLTQKEKIIIVSILLLASSLSVMSTDLYTPSMPHLPELLDTTADMIQLTLALNVLAFGAAQLILGPASDRYGRRPVFLVGIGLFALFSLGCALANTVEQLITARILQGAAASVEAVLVLAIFTDIFEEKQRIKAIALYGVVFALAPGVAPIIGGYVHVWFGWRANFQIVSVLGVLVSILALFYLHETGRADKNAILPRQLLCNYIKLLGARTFMVCSVMMALNLGILFTFITEAPFLLIDLFGVPTEQFGLYQLLIVATYAVGSLIASNLVRWISPQRLLNYSLLMGTIGVTILVVQEFLFQSTLINFISVFAFLMFALAPLWAIIPAMAMSAAPTGSGTASAMFGALEMTGAGGAGLLVSILHDGTSRPMITVIMIMFIGLLVTRWVGRSTSLSEM